MSHYVHPQGICESENIGEGTRVWAFAHVLPGARIGADGNIQIYVGKRIAVPLSQRPMPLGKGWLTVACPKLQMKGYYREVKTEA